MRRQLRRTYRHERQASINGRMWGAAYYQAGLLPGMETFPRRPDWSLGPAALACWAAFDRALLSGYIDAAQAAGEPVEVHGA